jgi:hypothetical protein
MGNSERRLGSPRYAGRDCRLWASLERAYGVADQGIAGLAGVGDQQVPPVAQPVRQGQRAQRQDPSRVVAGGLGKTGHPGLLRPPSLGRLSSLDLHDARRRRGGRQPLQRVSRAQERRSARSPPRGAFPEGDRFRAARRAPQALAPGHLVPQSCGQLLFPDQRALADSAATSSTGRSART